MQVDQEPRMCRIAVETYGATSLPHTFDIPSSLMSRVVSETLDEQREQQEDSVFSVAHPILSIVCGGPKGTFSSVQSCHVATFLQHLGLPVRRGVKTFHPCWLRVAAALCSPAGCLRVAEQARVAMKPLLSKAVFQTDDKCVQERNRLDEYLAELDHLAKRSQLGKRGEGVDNLLGDLLAGCVFLGTGSKRSLEHMADYARQNGGEQTLWNTLRCLHTLFQDHGRARTKLETQFISERRVLEEELQATRDKHQYELQDVRETQTIRLEQLVEIHRHQLTSVEAKLASTHQRETDANERLAECEEELTLAATHAEEQDRLLSTTLGELDTLRRRLSQQGYQSLQRENQLLRRENQSLLDTMRRDRYRSSSNYPCRKRPRMIS